MDCLGVYWLIIVIKIVIIECVSGLVDSVECDRGNGCLRMSVKICISIGCLYIFFSCYLVG